MVAVSLFSTSLDKASIINPSWRYQHLPSHRYRHRAAAAEHVAHVSCGARAQTPAGRSSVVQMAAAVLQLARTLSPELAASASSIALAPWASRIASASTTARAHASPPSSARSSRAF